MKYFSFLFIFFFRFCLIVVASDEKVIIKINDTLEVESENGRIEMINIEVTIINHTNKTILLNRQTGVTEIGSLTGEYLPNYCDSIDYAGIFRIFVFNRLNKALLTSPLLSVGDYVYFTKKGKLKYVYLEGIDKPNEIKKEFRKEKRLGLQPSIIRLNPYQKVKYKAKIYLGDYLFTKNEIYYLSLVYNNKKERNLSDICIESNRLVLLIK